MYCNNCGKLLRIALGKEEKCPHCSTTTEDADNKFCTSCGNILDEEKVCKGCGMSLLKKAEKG
jgi:RNA polymerase subunit RPABC4/transcription elongation factor Spt4